MKWSIRFVRAPSVRLGLFVALALAPARAFAEEPEQAPPSAATSPELAAINDGPPTPLGTPRRPRFYLRVEANQGFGATRFHGQTLAVFPTYVGLDLRIWRNISLEVGGTVMEVGTRPHCGARPTSAWLDLGLRYDFGNWRGGRWVVPFMEAHVAFASQNIDDTCQPADPLLTGGGRLGLDVWLGHAAVTVAVAFDYLPVASPVFFTLGGSLVAF